MWSCDFTLCVKVMVKRKWTEYKFNTFRHQYGLCCWRDIKQTPINPMHCYQLRSWDHWNALFVFIVDPDTTMGKSAESTLTKRVIKVTINGTEKRYRPARHYVSLGGVVVSIDICYQSVLVLVISQHWYMLSVSIGICYQSVLVYTISQYWYLLSVSIDICYQSVLIPVISQYWYMLSVSIDICYQSALIYVISQY